MFLPVHENRPGPRDADEDHVHLVVAVLTPTPPPASKRTRLAFRSLLSSRVQITPVRPLAARLFSRSRPSMPPASPGSTCPWSLCRSSRVRTQTSLREQHPLPGNSVNYCIRAPARYFGRASGTRTYLALCLAWKR